MAPAAAAAEGVRRSLSFQLLRLDVASDDDFSLPAEKISSRRRRRSKNTKGKLLQSSLSLSSTELEALDLPPPTAVDLESSVHSNGVTDSPTENGNAADDAARDSPEEHTCSSVVDDDPAVPLLLHSPLLRQRTVSGFAEADVESTAESIKKAEPEGGKSFPPLPQEFDPSSGAHWRQLMNVCNEYSAEVDFSPVQHVLDELTDGTSLEITTRAGNEQSRERVYNVLFNVPWRCELLIDVGFFVCLDSFLSLLTVTPVRLLMALFSRIRSLRTIRPNDWCDLGCLVILIAGVKALQLADISYIYHSIRFEPNIKLYVIYNMLEVFDKLFQSFGVDVLEVLFNSAASTVEGTAAGFLRLLFDQCIAVFCFIVHSFIMLFEAITLAAALHHAATNRSLLMLLMSNNFAEIKSNVFKRFNKQNMHSLAHNDTVERFHILTCLVFVFVQNITIVEGPWMSSFFLHAAMVMICEAFVDLIKHSFLAKFNSVEPAAYTEFLRTLCEQVVDRRRNTAQKALQFVPLGPACVLIKVLLPLYVSSESLWKCCLLFAGSFVILAAFKVVVAVLLHRYAAWFLRRSCDPEKHSHAD